MTAGEPMELARTVTPITRSRLFMAFLLPLTSLIGALLVVYGVVQFLSAGEIGIETLESKIASVSTFVSMCGLWFWSLRLIFTGRAPKRRYLVYIGFLLGLLVSGRMALYTGFIVDEQIDFLSMWIWFSPLVAYGYLIYVMHEHH